MSAHLNKAIVCLILISCIAGFAGCRAKRDQEKPRTHNSVDIQQLQSRAEKALEGFDGAAVIVDPRSGAVLAVVNPQLAQQAFPIGSAFKPLSAITAIEDGKAEQSLTSLCTGRAMLFNREFNCWIPNGHGRLDMTHALAQSCNIYFYRLGTRLSGQELARWAREFGFGQKTGLESAPSESAGHVPDVFPLHQSALFAAGDTQDLLATPLQMAVFVSAIANGGSVYSLHSDSEAGADKLIRKVDAERGISVAKQGMELAVKDPAGTCHSLLNAGHSVAGKTGTAKEQNGMKTHAWFIGYSPVDEPEVAVVVFLKRGRGATDAVPIARELFQSYFRCKIF